MLSDYPVYPTLPTSDLDAARPFYEDVLGFVPRDVNPRGIFYDAGEGTFIALTLSSGRASGSHTQVGFRVKDLDGLAADLRRRGVTFEEYETPKTVDGVATLPIGKAAWFKDPDGNLFGLLQFDYEG
jgi:catechol 2,3-dioxygenase-like lactoylglutathione lyase family enzyme